MFSFSRGMLFDAEIAQAVFAHTVLLAKIGYLMSDALFSVGGALLEKWASHKSFRPKNGSEGDDQYRHGERRSNGTHDRLGRPFDSRGCGPGAKLSYLANTTAVTFWSVLDVRHSTGTGKQGGALGLVYGHLMEGDMLVLDTGCDLEAFVEVLKSRGIRPHIARNTTNGRRRAIDDRTARDEAYTNRPACASAQAHRAQADERQLVQVQHGKD